MRIRYAEEVQLRVAAAPGASKPRAGGALAFTAYGRTFQLELQPNQRLTSSLPSSDQLAVTPYKGVVTGIAGSWVRLTEVDEQFSGAIWDGEQLYLLAPAQEAAASLEQPLAGGDATLIFRLADTEGGAIGGTCATTGTAGNGDSYGALLAELKGRSLQMQAATLGGEIEVSVLADAQFSSLGSAGTTARMIARMNVVDGIFSEQLGILITPVDLTLFDSGNDPFTGTDAIGLLEQLSSYRGARPTLQARGITHLMTGRDLNGSTIGIAYTGGVCDSRYGASLSEAGSGDLTAPLIIAHELGHNFGAPHDNATGSVCASTPGNWLMNPFFNGSDDFSSCSLQQIQAKMSTASCVLTPRIADVTVSVDTPTLRVPINRAYSFPVTVTSLGDQPSHDVQLAITGNPGSNFNADSVTTPAGVTCSTGGSTVCDFGTIAAGESRQVIVNMPAPTNAYTLGATARVTSTVDRRSANNTQSLTFEAFAGSDVSIDALAVPSNVVVDDIFEISFDVRADGVEAASNATATLSFVNGMTIDSASVAGGSCSVSTPMHWVTCQIGVIPLGEARRVVVRAVGTRGGVTYQLVAATRADNDAASPNNQRQFALSIGSRQDIAIEHPTPLPRYWVLGQSFDVPVDVWSRGIEPVTNATLTLHVNSTLTVQQVTATAGTCQVTGTEVSCALGTIAAGSSRRVTVTLRGAQVVLASIHWQVNASRNDNPNNDRISDSLPVRHANDVRIEPYGDRIGVEGPGQVYVGVSAVGVHASTNVTIRAQLPASHPVTAASIPEGTCTVSGSVAECVLPSLTLDRRTNMEVSYTADSPGTFTVQFSVTATADGDATNNQATTNITLAPYVDVRIQSAATRIDAGPGELINIPLTITADRRPVIGVELTTSSFSNITVESVSAVEGGTCSITPSSVNCALGDLPAYGTRSLSITARVNPSLEYSFSSSIYVYVRSPDDRDSSNNNQYIPVNVIVRGDAGVRVMQPTLNATRSESVNLPAISILGVRTLEGATLDLSLPATASVVTSPANCFARAGGLRCQFGILRAGTSLDVPISLRFSASGTSTIELQLSAAGDEDASNNTSSVAVTVTEPVSTGGGASGGGGGAGGGGGGGGGGALGWQTLLGLLMLLAARRSFPRKTASDSQ